MSYLNCIKPYQSVDLSNHLPFFIGDERVGWIQKPFAGHLKQFNDVFEIDDARVLLSNTLTNFDDRSHAIKEVLNTLVEEGILEPNPYGSHNPKPAYQKVDVFPVGSEPFTNPLLGIERYYFSLFGALRHNISVVGYTEAKKIWIAVRGEEKPKFPNRLDHTIGGGCTVEYNIKETIKDEGYDEAGLTEELIEKIKPIGVATTIRNTSNGDIFHERLNIFQLKLPDNFIPQSKYIDEIPEFKLLSFDEVNDEILNKPDLLKYSKIILIYFLIKQGYIFEDNKEYNDLIDAFNYNPEIEFSKY